MAMEDGGGVLADARTNEIRRRRFLQAGLAGAAVGAAWTAPSILTLDTAGAVGSACGAPQSFDWGQPGFTNMPGTTNNQTGWNAGSSTGGVGISVSFTNGAGTTGTTAREPNIQEIGDATNNFQIQKDGAAHNTSVTLTIEFSVVVFGLDFTLLDIDRDSTSGSHYWDRMTVNAQRANNTAVNPTNTYLGVPVGGTVAASPLRVTGTYPTFDGLTSAGDATTNSNVRLVYPNTVGNGIKRITLTYTSLTPSGCGGGCADSTTQWAGISRLAFC